MLFATPRHNGQEAIIKTQEKTALALCQSVVPEHSMPTHIMMSSEVTALCNKNGTNLLQTHLELNELLCWNL